MNRPSGGRRFISRSEVARMFEVSPNTVTRWAQKGRVPSFITPGGHHRYPRETIEQLLRRLQRGVTAG